MNQKRFYELLKQKFLFEPTPDQDQLMSIVAAYLTTEHQQSVFVLKGYAGTGKTSFVAALVKALPALDLTPRLLAPTGRAAKVLSGYSGREATTIHKEIYQIRTDNKGTMQVRLRENLQSDTLYIVDEASMISNSDSDSNATLFGNRNLLTDLVDYVNMGVNCMLMFVGDTAQLPPVKLNISPALDTAFLQQNLHYRVEEFELKHVVRQKNESGILLNATALRILIGRQAVFPILKEKDFYDVTLLHHAQVPDQLSASYSEHTTEDTIIICRSNKQANRYNQLIRRTILDHHDEVNAGDEMMVLKNNYFWLEDDPVIGFIANGDVISIKSIRNIEEAYGFRFADAEIRFADYPHHHGVQVKLLLSTVYADTPALSYEDNKLLFNNLLQVQKARTKRARIEKVLTNEYFNALQVKFSYAITCHKAQGGQWKSVFVDQGFMPDESYSTEHLRWLYTAVTRATDKLYLVNFEEKFMKQ